MTFVQRHQSALTCALLVLWVLCLFDDVVFHNLNLALAGTDTGFPNDDAQVLLYPFFDHLIDSIRATGLPDPWNPYIWGGTPAIGNPNVPFNLPLFGLLHLSKPAFLAAMNWHLVLEFCLAATGVFLLFRRLGLAWWQATLSALLAVHASSAAWLTNTYCIFFHWAAIPWALLTLLTLERRSTLTSSVFLGAIFYYQFTYGQSQMTLYSVLFIGVGVLWIFREAFDRKKAVRCLGAGLLVGFCLALHAILPQIEFLLNSAPRQTGDWSTLAARYRVPASYLLNLFVPRLFRQPIPWWPLWDDGWSLWESFNVYIGIFFAVSAVYGLREFWGPKTQWRPAFSPRLKVLAFVLVLTSVTESGGRALVALHLGQGVPYSRFNQFLLYPLILCAVCELPLVFSSRKELGKFSAFLGACLLGIVLLSREFALFTAAFFRESMPLSRYAPSEAESLAKQFLSQHKGGLSEALFGAAATLAQILTCLLLALVLYRRVFVRRLLLAVALGFGTWDLVRFFDAYRQRGRDSYPFNEVLGKTNPLLESLKTHSKDLEHYTFSTFTGTMEVETGLAPNLNALAKVVSVNGYTSFIPKGSGLEPNFYRGNWGYPFSEGTLKLLSVRFILVGKWTPDLPYADKLRTIARFKDYRLVEYSSPVPDHYFPKAIAWNTPAVEQTKRFEDPAFDPRELSYSESGGKDIPSGCQPLAHWDFKGGWALENPCGRGVYFAFRSKGYPWWRLSLDGEPARRIPLNRAHEAVEIPPGTHRLEWSCVPMSWYWGLGLSALTALVLLGLALLSLGRYPSRFAVGRGWLRSLQPE